MKTITASFFCTCLALAAGGVAAQDKKPAPAAPKPMSMQECNDYTAMAKKDATKKDAKKDTMCADMMNKEKMKK